MLNIAINIKKKNIMKQNQEFLDLLRQIASNPNLSRKVASRLGFSRRLITVLKSLKMKGILKFKF